MVQQRKLGLVYGGARVGLMGTISSPMYEQNGEIISVIPKTLVNKSKMINLKIHF